MHVGVGNLKPGDQQPNSARRHNQHLGLSNGLSNLGQMSGCRGIEVGPLIDLGTRNHQAVPGGQRSNVEKRHTNVVFPQHAGGNLSVDDLREDASHVATVDPQGQRGREIPTVRSTPMSTEWRPFTIPNAISALRLACIPWFVWLLFAQDDRLGAAVLLGVLGSTDWTDGWFARRFDQVSELGKLLDPTADRLMMLTAVVSTWIDESVPAWFAALVLLREGLVSLAALGLGALGVTSFDITWWGKTGTFLLMFAFPLLLGGASTVAGADILRIVGWAFAISGLAISWFAAWGYVAPSRQALADARTKSD